MSRTDSWLGPEVSGLAADRILDAAAEHFAAHGPQATSMGAIARAAGCSRATLYRYFDSRRALQIAFAQREALRILEQVERETAAVTDPRARAAAAVVTALDEVRSRPMLAAWISPENSGELLEVLRDSEMIEAVTARFVRALDARPDVELARWVLRSLVSLLTFPAPDRQEERRLVERFLVPLFQL